VTAGRARQSFLDGRTVQQFVQQNVQQKISLSASSWFCLLIFRYGALRAPRTSACSEWSIIRSSLDRWRATRAKYSASVSQEDRALPYLSLLPQRYACDLNGNLVSSTEGILYNLRHYTSDNHLALFADKRICSRLTMVSADGIPLGAEVGRTFRLRQCDSSDCRR